MRREELFNRREELEALHANKDVPITIITGIRRIGKTSLLNVFLSELEVPGIVVDLRDLKSNYGIRDLYELLSRALSSRLDKLIYLLKSISSIKVVGTEVQIRWRGRGSLTLSTLFDHLNRRRIVIAFDEAQKLRGPRSREVLEAVAHAYDYDENVTFAFTGSEAGLLCGFLGIDDPSSPLYGRYCFRLTLERFGKDLSAEFLKQGFKEVGLDVDPAVIEEAVEAFDGIPGWLTIFGNEYARGVRDFETIKKMAIDMALRELKNIVKERGKRLALALKGIAEGADTWGKLKRFIEEREGTTISSSVLFNVVKSLEDLSIIEGYKFLDPIYEEAAKKL